ncbi:MAG: MBL fold metallo-hydrolase [Chloroflexi bacterium]|nr:MBL fold metallo-hydrolase [Chloroflexota bacterium]
MPMTFFEPDVKLQDGEVVRFGRWVLQAVWTPGHTPGHMCLYEPNHRLMFTGDHVLPYISPNVSLHADQEGTSPLSDFRESLRKVAAFDTVAALPAHEFTIADLPARCDVLLHHHDDRLEEVRAAIGTSGPASTRTISQRVSWNTGPFDDFNIFMKRSALGETLSHLQYLADEGRVRSVQDGDRVLWVQAG